MSQVFVKMRHACRDDFDVTCCFVMDKHEFNKNMTIVQYAFDANVFNECSEFCFGTDEFLQFYSFDDFEMGVSDQPCSEDFYHEFINLTGGCVGFNVLERMVERATEAAHDMVIEQEETEE